MELRNDNITVDDNDELNNKTEDMLFDIEDTPFVTPAPKLSKDEFYKHSSMKMLRNSIQSVGIVCYISAIATVALSVLQATLDKSINVTAAVVGSLITAVIIISLGLGIHLMRSKICMYILLGFAAINCIASIIMEGVPGGILILMLAIMGTININNFEKAWEEYQTTGQIVDINIDNPLTRDIKFFK